MDTRRGIRGRPSGNDLHCSATVDKTVARKCLTEERFARMIDIPAHLVPHARFRRPVPCFTAPVYAGSDREAPRSPARRRREDTRMDDVVNRFARELADAIAAAVAENPQV